MNQLCYPRKMWPVWEAKQGHSDDPTATQNPVISSFRWLNVWSRFIQFSRFPGWTKTCKYFWYIRWVVGCVMSSISLPIKIEFAISLIVRCHYILWSSHFQTVNSKVNNTYINLDFRPTPEKQKSTSGSPNLLGLWKGTLFLIFVSSLIFIW